ncbi:MAG: polysaccharide deacetylase family protein [Armatimonadota bacterium]|nr:polysaccharide deacetylase family protein [Armatimonadota bacterium]
MGAERMFFRPILQGAIRASGFLSLARRMDARPDTFRVLVYHRIAEPDGPACGDPTLISASPEMFRVQVRYLARHYNPVSGDRVLQALRGEAALPPRAVLVTFDDGYRDFATHAWPILKEYGVPAVMFVPTAFPSVGRAFWWDVLHDVVAGATVPHATLPMLGPTALGTEHERQATVRRLNRRLRLRPPEEVAQLIRETIQALGVPVPEHDLLLCWNDLRALASEGLMVAAHTRHHPPVPSLRPEDVADEIRQARADLQRELGAAPPMFAYPFGMADPDALPILEAEGIVAAFTMAPGANTLGETNPLLLCRRAVNGAKTLTDLALSLISPYARLQHWRWQRAHGSGLT